MLSVPSSDEDVSILAEEDLDLFADDIFCLPLDEHEESSAEAAISQFGCAFVVNSLERHSSDCKIICGGRTFGIVKTCFRQVGNRFCEL